MLYLCSEHIPMLRVHYHYHNGHEFEQTRSRTEETRALQSMGSQGVGHNLATVQRSLSTIMWMNIVSLFTSYLAYFHLNFKNFAYKGLLQLRIF